MKENDKNIQFLLWLDKDLKTELEKEAKQMGLSLSSYLRLLLRHRKETVFYDNNIKK